MTTFTFENNISTTLTGSVSPSSSAITLSSLRGLPASIPAGYSLVITLNDQATRNNYEIIYATSVNGATLSGLSRGQEGTTALSWLAGDFAYSGPTAGQMGSFTQVAQFSSILATNGYKQYPDPNSPTGYFIEQWGSGLFAAQLTTTENFPFVFPNAVLNFQASLGAVINLTSFSSVGGQSISTSQYQITVAAPETGSAGVWWVAKGY